MDSIEGKRQARAENAGFGVGPLIWAPLSEMLGRRWAFNASFPLFAIFNMAGALSINMPMLLIMRFLAGTFGSAPLTNGASESFLMVSGDKH